MHLSSILRMFAVMAFAIYSSAISPSFVRYDSIYIVIFLALLLSVYYLFESGLKLKTVLSVLGKRAI